MPKRNVRDVVHTAYTDHRIQRPGAPAAAGEGGLRPWRPPPAAYALRNAALAWFEWGASIRDTRAIESAAAQLANLSVANDDEQVLSARGAIALQKNAPGEALAWYSRVLRLQPQDAETQFRMGRAEHAAGRPGEAVKRFNEAIRLDPLLFDAYVLAAQLHRAKGDWPSYRRTLERYLRHVPHSLAARQALAAGSR